jgi:probable phosphoglycerate mutase
MTYSTTSGAEASQPGCVVLLRHGQTAWSVSGQHTGRTDIPLTMDGQRQAEQAGERIRGLFANFDARYVFVSPLHRARQTAQLAGFSDYRVLNGIAEWDYGRAEGRTREEISELNGKPWNLWNDGTQTLGDHMEGDRTEILPSGESVHIHNGVGETLEEAAVRARGVVEHILPMVESGNNVMLVAHAHILRILTTQWLDVDPLFAKRLRLDTAHFSVLGIYKGDRVIDRWNL